ncbi:MAG: hypothetical protein ACRDRR_05645 [Pseudonocardiaceae bacterium]
MSSYERISVTVPADIAQQVRKAAEDASETISGWLTTAAQHRLRLDAGRQLLAEYEAELGAVTEQERAAIDAEIATARRSAQPDGPGRARRSA